MASRHVFRGRARFFPPRSLLGLLCKRWIRDELKAEAWHLIGASSAAFAGAIAVVALTSLGEVRGWNEEQLWLWSWGAYGLLLAACLIGFARGVTVTVTTASLSVRQGGRDLDLPLSDIGRCQIVSALVYYRNYAPYRDTMRFMTRIPEDVLVLAVGESYIAIGLSPAQHAEINGLIRRESMDHAEVTKSVHVGHGV